MLDYIKRHHIALLALFIALGGTSYAATQLPSNSVGSRQIRAGAISSPKIQNGAVTPAKLSPAVKALLGKSAPVPAAEAAWRDPNILQAISAASQKVLSQTVVTVPATAPWVQSGASIAPGQHLWIDTRSDGEWSGNPRLFPYSDANGLPVYPGQYRVDAKANVESLIGFIGASPPTPREVSVPIGSPKGGAGGATNPGFIEPGNTLTNLAPATTGAIWLRNNDNTNCCSDAGKQIVKIIITD